MIKHVTGERVIIVPCRVYRHFDDDDNDDDDNDDDDDNNNNNNNNASPVTP